jgi:hypothetical protein
MQLVDEEYCEDIEVVVNCRRGQEKAITRIFDELKGRLARLAVFNSSRQVPRTTELCSSSTTTRNLDSRRNLHHKDHGYTKVRMQMQLIL